MKGPLKGKAEDVKCAYLLLWLGEKGRDLFSTWSLAANETDKLDVYLTKFKNHITPTVNPIVARYRFYKRDQQVGEPIEKFITDVRLLSQHCDFPVAIQEEMIRDRIVCGIVSEKAREKLLDKGAGLDLTQAISITRNYEITQAHLADMGSNPKQTQQEIDAIHTRQGRKPTQQATGDNSRQCYQCGGPYNKTHSQSCPAKGKSCDNCGRLNHFARVCRSRRNPKSAVDSIDNPPPTTEDEESKNLLLSEVLLIDSAAFHNTSRRFPMAKVNVVGAPSQVVFKLDTGAEANVLPDEIRKSFHPVPQLVVPTQSLWGYGGARINCIGTFYADCSVNGKHKRLLFHVVNQKATPIFSYQACLDFGLISITDLSINEVGKSTKIPEPIRKYEHVFQGQGKMEGPVKVYTRPDIRPVVQAPRRVPFALQAKLKEELDRLESEGIIEKVSKPTEWVNSMVVVEKKDGGLRLCLDPRDLNEAIIRPHYPVPTFDDVAARIHGHTRFTKLDARCGYWMLVLDEQSSELTTFNTPSGRYKYKRLPFGLNCSQDIFQQRMEQAFSGLEGVNVIADDIVVSGKDDEEHDRNLNALLKRAEEANIKFHPSKFIYKQPCIPYFGNQLTAEGVKPDPFKIEALTKMPNPQNHEELATFLGMVNYLSRFIRDLSTINHPLRELGKSAEFIWLPTHTQAVEKIKQSIIDNLRHFDPTTNELELTTDASQHGLGAHLSIQGDIVCFASKALNKTEQNYSQIEKELYAILFGCKRFHQYIYGRRVTVYTDHKPLESVLTKPLFQTPARLQRMLVALQPYRHLLTVKFKPGSDIPVADALSRLHPDSDGNLSELQDEIELHVHAIAISLPVSDQKMAAIAAETQKDETMAELKRLILHGWPKEKRQCKAIVEDYWNFRDELSVVGNIIVKGERIVIPKALRAECLRSIHCSHLGIEKTKQRAREVIFWPGLNQDIELLIRSCETCGKVANSNPKQPLLSTPPPQFPWQIVGFDLCSSAGRDYLVTCDFYSRYIEIDYLSSTTSAAVITKLKAHFSRHGIPEKVCSDNGSQLASAEFSKFAKDWDFKQLTSSPVFPQANGQAEKAVDIAKRLIEKAADAGVDPFLALLEYRNTPVGGFKSPAQLLYSRNLRSVAPCLQQHLFPKVVDPAEARRVRLASQARQQQYFNRGAAKLCDLTVNQAVWVQLDGSSRRWTQATVTSKVGERSYWVETSDGGRYRRNRIHLKPRVPASTAPVLPVPASAAPVLPVPAPSVPVLPPPSAIENPPSRRPRRTINPPDRLDL